VKVFIAVAICKALYFIGSRVGRGSSLSGQIALKVCPGVLARLKLPKTVIAVTGSNGKTSTVEFIARALEAGGMSVGWNHEGSNQIEGVATLLLRTASFGGKVRRDALVLESDERYARAIFEAVKPSVLVVTNLCRDQLTRNGHHEFIFDRILSAIEAAGDGTALVLNADDPYVAAFDNCRETAAPGSRAVWFGIGRDACLTGLPAGDGIAPVYDDGAFCPVCKGRMAYAYRIAGHYGKFCCGACGHSRREPDVEVTALDYSTGEMTLGVSAGAGGAGGAGASAGAGEGHPAARRSLKARLLLPGIPGAYNLAAAIAAAMAAGLDAGDAARALDGYELEGGRTVRFSAGGREGMLLISKHENSMSYNQSMAWIVSQRKPCTVIVMVDSISRKYYTSETSWLWDVDFDILGDGCVRSVVLAGRYFNELMARLAMSAVDPGKCSHVGDIAAIRDLVERCGTEPVYAITCFADKAKLLKAFE